jgi:hypothetical protein
MPQSATFRAGPSLVPHTRSHGWQLRVTLASAASAGGTPAAGYDAIAQPVLDKLMQESK